MNNRLDDLDRKISSFENTRKTIVEDKIESKRWREIFETELQSMHIKLENVTRKQKENFKSTGKQISAYDDKLTELNVEINSLKEPCSAEMVENLRKDVKKFDKAIDQLKEEMSGQREEPCILSAQIRRHAKLIADLQKDGKKNMVTTTEELDDLYLKVSWFKTKQPALY